MASEDDSGSVRAMDALFGLTFRNTRAPDLLELSKDADLISRIREMAPLASLDDCRAAIERTRDLCDTVYEICEIYRTGRFGAGSRAVRSSIREIARRSPGFTAREYEEAFAAGLRWTAF